ncbi:MAG: hypothetical protein K2W85_14415 [Phycisphaerales bacterium]|nr:hypothetical protein [Phycisphaerales bacterium]
MINTCDGVFSFTSDGEGGPENVPLLANATFTVPAQTAQVPLRIVFFTREWPNWPGHTLLGPDFRDSIGVQIRNSAGIIRFSQEMSIWSQAATFVPTDGLPGGTVVVYDAAFNTSAETLNGSSSFSVLISTTNRNDNLYGGGAKVSIASGLQGSQSDVIYIAPMTGQSTAWGPNGFRVSDGFCNFGDSLLLDDVVLRNEKLRFVIFFRRNLGTYANVPPIYINTNVPNGFLPNPNTWVQLPIVGGQNARWERVNQTDRLQVEIDRATIAQLSGGAIRDVPGTDSTLEAFSTDRTNAGPPPPGRAESSRRDSDSFDRHAIANGYVGRGSSRGLFDGDYYNQLFSPCSSFLGRSDPLRGPASLQRIKAAGTRLVAIRCDCKTSGPIQVEDQADIAYFSSHGYRLTNRMEFTNCGRRMAHVNVTPADIGTAWRSDLDEVIIAGCSLVEYANVNGVVPANTPANPGLKWATLGPSLVLGYNAVAPIDELAAPVSANNGAGPQARGLTQMIAQRYFRLRFGPSQISAPVAWLEANKFWATATPQPPGNGILGQRNR